VALTTGERKGGVGGEVARPSAFNGLLGGARVKSGYIANKCSGTWLTRTVPFSRRETVPWTETCAVRERERFVTDHASGQWSLSELCERYGVSRPTGYKWLERYDAGGAQGLADRSRAPRSCPHRTSATVVKLILEEADRYGWGARKVLRRLSSGIAGCSCRR
jgi:transposase-like protein